MLATLAQNDERVFRALERDYRAGIITDAQIAKALEELQHLE